MKELIFPLIIPIQKVNKSKKQNIFRSKHLILNTSRKIFVNTVSVLVSSIFLELLFSVKSIPSVKRT